MEEYVILVNGRQHKVEASADMPLLWVIREHLGLTGTKYGCGVGICGACTVHEKGEPVRSCQITVNEATGSEFITIEGLSENGDHPCQKAWIEEDVSQCGFCQPGMIMNAAALLRANRKPDDRAIDDAMSGSVCRCGTYFRIRKAIKRASEVISE